MKKTNAQFNPRDLFFAPADLGALYVEYGDYLQKTPGITWGVSSIDSKIIPIRPGQLCFIVARPGHGKSTTAAYLAKKTALEIKAAGEQNKKCVVYISLDQPVEEIYAMLQSDETVKLNDYAWGRVSHETLARKAIDAVDVPLWAIGRSVMQRRAPRLTFQNIYAGLERMEAEYKIRPALVIIDYIQIIPIESKQTRTDQVSEAVIRARELAAQLAVPMLILAQATRGVDSYENKIPRLSDCQHSSAIEQDADKVFGVWRPILTEESETLSVRTVDRLGNAKMQEVDITENLFVIGNTKQRMEKSGARFFCYLDPALVKLSDLELERENRNASQSND